MEIQAGGESDVGRARETNEDYFYVDNTKGLFIVCDGLGGHSGGEIASHRAIEFTIEYLDEHWDSIAQANKNPVGYFKLTQLVEKAIHNACRRIKELADDDPSLAGMATTLTLLLVVDGNAIVGHVGDSRLYIKRAEVVFQLTTDHTLLNEIVSSGNVKVDPSQIQKFSHCLTRSVGNHESVAVETLIFEARQHDVLLLCTDGLSNHFSDSDSVAQMLFGKNVNEMASSLVRFANENGGQDNITAVVIRVVDVDDFKLNSHRIKLDFENASKTLPSCD